MTIPELQAAVEHLTSNLQNPKYYGPRETASLRTILTALEAAQLAIAEHKDSRARSGEAITKLFTRYKTGHFRDCICNICELEKELNTLLQ